MNSVSTPATGAAPTWRATAQPNVRTPLTLSSPPGAIPGDHLEANPVGACPETGGGMPARPVPQHATPPASSLGSIDSAFLTEFAFTACEFSQNGELLAAEKTPPGASAGSSRLADALVASELMFKAQVQKEAVAAYIAAQRDTSSQAGAGSGRPAAGSALADLQCAQQSLDTEVSLFELALEQETGSGLLPFLQNIAAKLGEIRKALASLSAFGANDGTGAGVLQHALMESLAAVETACRMGVEILTDGAASRADMPAAANQPSGQRPLPLTQSNQAFLDSLDSLLDKEIGADL
jgi:hypothetical protein